MSFFQKKLKEQDEVDQKVAYEGLMGYRVIRYFNKDYHRVDDFWSRSKADVFAIHEAREHKILCRVFEQYPSGDKQVFEIDKSEKYDEPMGCLSWILLILGIAFVVCSIILPIIKTMF
jgi:hypothetical protein